MTAFPIPHPSALIGKLDWKIFRLSHLLEKFLTKTQKVTDVTFCHPQNLLCYSSLQNAQHPGISTHAAASLTQAAVSEKIQLSSSK